MSNCNIKNPLVRDGVSQAQRLLKALSPSYVLSDEHSVSDLINIAKNYAFELQYYNSDNQPDGDWQDLIKNDVSTIASAIASTDMTVISGCFDKNYSVITESSLLNNNTKIAFDNLFREILFIVDRLNGWYENSIPSFKLNTELSQAIKSHLNNNLKDAIAYYKFASATSNKFVKQGTSNGNCSDVLYEDDILQSSFDAIWIVQDSSYNNWQSYITNYITADSSAYGDSSLTKIQRVKTAAGKLKQIYEKFYNTGVRLINDAPAYLEETLQSYPQHQPHVALFLTFLQLFKTAQNDLNKITGRHLDFYYKEVLQIEMNDEVPDEVNLIFTLAKQVDSYLLKEGTQLKAGKDSTGKEVIYETEEDVVLNKASIELLKTVFIDYNDQGRVYDAPAANSKDGQGKAFDSDEPKWKTFGESQSMLSSDQITMEYTEIGFAISSPVLLLNEGIRDVTLTLYVSGPVDKNKISTSNFKIYLSAKNKWIDVDPKTVIPTTKPNIITISFKLAADVDPIIDFDSSGLEGEFYPSFPVLKLILVNDPSVMPADSSYAYKLLQDLKITQFDIETSVTGLSNVILQNDNGLLKAGKPFYPFGNIPGVGSNFYIGSKEIFQKNLTDLTITINWKDVPSDKLKTYYENLLTDIKGNSYFKVKVLTLNDYSWNQIGSLKDKNIKSELFNKDNAKDKADIIFTKKDFAKYSSGLIEDDLTSYDVGTKRGFINLQLSDPPDAFGHMIFPAAYTEAIIDYAKSNIEKSLIPNQPYTPFIESLKIKYTAKHKIKLPPSKYYDEDTGIFYHIYPFGIKEIKTGAEETTLLPQFKTEIGSEDMHSEGELYIGISSLNPSETLSVLFEMAEGSANPEVNTPDVVWYYLSSNDWIKFDDTEIISDYTNGLIQSGIITLNIPEDADREHTILTTGYYWVKASVAENSEGVCDTIDIIAQAVKAIYIDNSNATDFLENVLPAGTISKMKEKEPDIKTISQPYSSLEGKPSESEKEYYTRVSERLRHKDRGITIWDYERIVLQQFPSIYKVKCINHSEYNSDVDEFAPGYVSVIVIPTLYNKNAVDPLEPRASVAAIKEIYDFLCVRVSPFLKETLKVMNPQYEKIKAEFKVKFRKSYDDWGYYSTLLQNDIIEFLSPWAFKEGGEISFGGKIHSSVILNFIEERYYVDFVTDFNMAVITEDVNGNEVIDYTEEALPSTARSIFVSNKTHKIDKVINC